MPEGGELPPEEELEAMVAAEEAAAAAARRRARRRQVADPLEAAVEELEAAEEAEAAAEAELEAEPEAGDVPEDAFDRAVDEAVGADRTSGAVRAPKAHISFHRRIHRFVENRPKDPALSREFVLPSCSGSWG